ncbi:MAG: DHH family phosphoesterase [Patescibacteria group bacterium]
MNLNGRLEKIKKLLREAPPRISIVLSHLDPDSMGAADNMQEICEHFGKSADIYAAGKPDRRMNEAIINQFHLNFIPVERFVSKGEGKDFIILLDTPTLNDARLKGLPPLKFNIVIDHHTRPGNLPAESDNTWYWYENCGAACSLTSYLLKELEMEIDKDNVNNTANLSAIGILADTKRFTSLSATQFDREMFAYLGNFVNQKRINEIFFSTLDLEFWDIINKASNPERRRFGIKTCITYVEDLQFEFRHYLETISDMLITTGGIYTAWIWSLVDGRIVGNVRNIDPELTLDKKIKEVAGEDGGGSKDNNMGAFSFAVPEMLLAVDKETQLRVVKTWFEKKVLR